MGVVFRGRVAELEIARGHDGLFRGPPDPVLVVGVYAVGDGHAALVGRSLHRFRPTGSFPSKVPPRDDERALPTADLRTDAPMRFVALAVALEEDGGKDVQRIYGAVEHVGKLALWAAEHLEVDPVGVGGLEGAAWSAPVAVDLQIDGALASATCTSDKWIGAVAWALAPRKPAWATRYRLPFQSADRRNDWTALLDVTH